MISQISGNTPQNIRNNKKETSTFHTNRQPSAGLTIRQSLNSMLKQLNILSKQLRSHGAENKRVMSANGGHTPNNNVPQGVINLSGNPTLSTNLTSREAQNIRDRLNSAYSMNLSSTQAFTIDDIDGDQKLSRGDVIGITQGSNGGAIQLSREDALIINSDPIGSRQDFLDNKQKWMNNRPSSYTFTLKNNQGGSVGGSDFLKPVDINFESFAGGVGNGGHTFSRFSNGSSNPVPSVNQRNIDDLFDIIEDALNETPVIPVVIQYNAQLGYPEVIHIDYIPSGDHDDLDYVISDFFEGQTKLGIPTGVINAGNPISEYP